MHFILLSLSLKKNYSLGVGYYTWVTLLISHLVLPFQDSLGKWLYAYNARAHPIPETMHSLILYPGKEHLIL